LPCHEIAGSWERRRDLFAACPALAAITPSRWLASQACAGLWANHRVEVIPYGIPTEIFRPLDRAYARRALGIPEGSPVLLLAAQYLTDRRKGAEILPQLGPLLKQRPLTLVTMGHGTLTVPDEGIRVISLGWVDSVDKQVLVYNAADVLLHPAPVDNFPNVVLEALACGTPTVALPVGGLPELVRPNVSGWLADAPTSEALAQAVETALYEVRDGRDLRASCRFLAEDKFTLEAQAEKYITLAQELQPLTA
jgi:glycosyltransferase involved in cell wall biosynthesis